MTSLPTVRVWDAPTRLFHWSLLALVILCWVTAEGEGSLASVHRYAGETIAGADGSRQPSAKELAQARFQGAHVAKIAAKLHA